MRTCTGILVQLSKSMPFTAEFPFKESGWVKSRWSIVIFLRYLNIGSTFVKFFICLYPTLNVKRSKVNPFFPSKTKPERSNIIVQWIKLYLLSGLVVGRLWHIKKLLLKTTSSFWRKRNWAPCLLYDNSLYYYQARREDKIFLRPTIVVQGSFQIW